MTSQTWQLVSMIVWWGSVIGAFVIAGNKGRNRLGWVVFAAFVPLIAILILALLPKRRTA